MLPKRSHPYFEIKIPSLKKTHKFRPFTVREEKILLLVKEGSEFHEKVDAVQQIIENCCMSKIDCNKLAYFDIEYIFIKLRAISVNNIIELTYKDDKNKSHDFEIDLNDIDIEEKKTDKIIKLSENYAVEIQYPNYKNYMKMIEEKDMDKLFKLYSETITAVYDSETEYRNFTSEEIEEFLLDCTTEEIEKIYEFFSNMPVLQHETTIKTEDGDEKIILRGLSGFFPNLQDTLA